MNRNDWSRRQVVAAGAALGLAHSTKVYAQASPQALHLVPKDPARQLPERLIGGSVSFPFEYIFEPAKVTALEKLRIAYTRFPGGSYSQLFDWRTGRLEPHPFPDSSDWIKLWITKSKTAAAMYPNGMHYAEYLHFSQKIGAVPTFVANLETDTVESQTQWIKSLVDQGTAPPIIELGSEFPAAMAGDPHSMARWPDMATSLAIVKTYADSFRPVLSKQTKFGVPVGSENFFGFHDTKSAVAQRHVGWNEGFDSHSWVDALIVHPYCDALNLTPLASGPPATQADGVSVLNALLAHYDQGLETMLSTVAARAPGKEIWLTEWNPRVGDYARRGYNRALGAAVTQPLALQTVSRAFLTMLRQPAVTINLYFMLNFLQGDVHCLFVPDEHGGYAPIAVATAMGWFADAANFGARYQRLVEPDAPSIAGGGHFAERYSAIEGAQFDHETGSTILVQNASAGPRSLGLVKAKDADKIEAISLTDLTDHSTVPAVVQSIAPAAAIVLPPYSLTRIVWQA